MYLWMLIIKLKHSQNDVRLQRYRRNKHCFKRKFLYAECQKFFPVFCIFFFREKSNVEFNFRRFIIKFVTAHNLFILPCLYLSFEIFFWYTAGVCILFCRLWRYFSRFWNRIIYHVIFVFNRSLIFIRFYCLLRQYRWNFNFRNILFRCWQCFWLFFYSSLFSDSSFTFNKAAAQLKISPFFKTNLSILLPYVIAYNRKVSDKYAYAEKLLGIKYISFEIQRLDRKSVV